MLNKYVVEIHTLLVNQKYYLNMAIKMETGEIIYEKEFESPRMPPQISLNHDWMKESGSEVAQRPH